MITENRLLRHSDENRRAENSCSRTENRRAVARHYADQTGRGSHIMAWPDLVDAFDYQQAPRSDHLQLALLLVAEDIT
jgi:hypothetical protein